MNLVPTPEVTLADSEVADALGRAVCVINPLLDVLWGTDPLDLKRRTSAEDAVGNTDDGALDKVADGLGWALNAAAVPGTPAWDTMDADARIDWWVGRVGAVNNIAVAFPGFLGVLARRLPLQDLLGFANQAIVLCAAARELGVTDRDQQVRLLAAVLCDRELAADGDLVDRAAPEAAERAVPRTPAGIAKALWQLLGLLNAVSGELAKRPHPRAPFRYLGMLPAVGAVAAYFGELGALARAAKQGQKWIAAHTVPAAAP